MTETPKPIRAVCSDCGIAVVWDDQLLRWNHDLPVGTNVRHMPVVKFTPFTEHTSSTSIFKDRIDELEGALLSAINVLSILDDWVWFDIEISPGNEISVSALIEKLEACLKSPPAPHKKE